MHFFKQWGARLIVFVLLGTGLVAFGPATPANADPACSDVYVLWARGSGQGFDDGEAKAFKKHIFYALDQLGYTNHSWAELGNLDNDFNGTYEPGEYPAANAAWAAVMPPIYNNSVSTGVNELILHLNDRYNGDGPTGSGPCSNETLVVGGYSQGAQVVGSALQTQAPYALSQAAKNRIGAVALYGDPKSNRFDCGSLWLRSDAGCGSGNQGIVQARNPYLPGGFSIKTGSWCQTGDGVCHFGAGLPGSHTTIYRDYPDENTPSGQIWLSAAEVASWARNHKLGCLIVCPTELISAQPSSSVGVYLPILWKYKVKNITEGAVSIKRIVVAIRGPNGQALDQPCANGGTGMTLQRAQVWECVVNLQQGFGQAGIYRYWADWQDFNNVWHEGQLGRSDNYLALVPGPTLSVTSALSVGPSNPVPMYTGVFWSYRVKNTSGGALSVKKFVVAVRTPGGGNMDVTCNGGDGVALAIGAEFTCAAYNNNGYGSTGGFQFWADWQDYANQWHPGTLGSTLTLYVN